MHEVSIAQSILNTIIKEHDKAMLTKITAVGVRVGALSGIMADALEFGFDALKKETPLKNSKLVIETVDVGGICNECEYEFGVDDFHFKCPQCGSTDIEVRRGMELDIAFLELETVEEETGL